MKTISINDLSEFKIGHTTNVQAGTGCTVLLSEEGAVAGVDVRGGSPGTKETDLLKSENLVNQVHGIFLSGGSAFGLDVGGGVLKFLEEKNIGFDVSVAKVPIVPGAILFDLMVGEPKTRPDAQYGYDACIHALDSSVFNSGSVGAGTGATIGKVLGSDYVMKGGIGSYAIQIGDLKVGAVVAVNCFGDVIDPSTGTVIAGVQADGKLLFTEKQLLDQIHDAQTNRFNGNTTIGCIITNASMTKAEANKIASCAHDGLARTMRPSHAFVDGDTLFVMSSDRVKVDLNGLASIAANVVEQAVLDAVKSADSLFGIKAYKDMEGKE
ncbi:P1 family peptidase [Halobacillus yeomjeoni]|uniref:P1 family peptidase n=1 Tax=Halobacillus yeomjeoni TaxID=311194 RepID=A0A931HTY5_9BACI|nr:P1 family peptidase [Halobacillus yeomjeoni]MBH0229495.1 P1 family peptidase [Halobacillus yeomjeoni]